MTGKRAGARAKSKSVTLSAAKGLEGRTAPAFTAMNDADESLSLTSLRGRTVVLFFYPKDDTPG